MTYEKFLNDIERLRDCFGAPRFSDERVVALWDSFKHENDEHFSKAVQEIILEERYAPTATTIREYLAKFRPSHSIRNWVPVDCRKCKGSGTLFAKNIDTGYRVFFHCTCENAKYTGLRRLPDGKNPYSPVWDNQVGFELEYNSVD